VVKKTLQEAIFKTLLYADIFDYPLKEEEIWLRLIKVKSQKSKVKMRNARGIKQVWMGAH